MHIEILATRAEMAAAAASAATDLLLDVLRRKERVRLLAATGNSQLEFLDFVTANRAVDWTRIELFHLDEYVGLGIEHPASFARYIKGRIVDPTGIRDYHLIDGSREPHETAQLMSSKISSAPVDVAFAGIGENGHLAFNDPPADFEADDPYIVVTLDERCRQQQIGEGWFDSIEDVPTSAVTISIKQLLRSDRIICVVPDARKAEAVAACLEGPITPDAPASALQKHHNAMVFLDRDSAALLRYRRLSR